MFTEGDKRCCQCHCNVLHVHMKYFLSLSSVNKGISHHSVGNKSALACSLIHSPNQPILWQSVFMQWKSCDVMSWNKVCLVAYSKLLQQTVQNKCVGNVYKGKIKQGSCDQTSNSYSVIKLESTGQEGATALDKVEYLPQPQTRREGCVIQTWFQEQGIQPRSLLSVIEVQRLQWWVTDFTYNWIPNLYYAQHLKDSKEFIDQIMIHWGNAQYRFRF